MEHNDKNHGQIRHVFKSKWVLAIALILALSVYPLSVVLPWMMQLSRVSGIAAESVVMMYASDVYAPPWVRYFADDSLDHYYRKIIYLEISYPADSAFVDKVREIATLVDLRVVTRSSPEDILVGLFSEPSGLQSIEIDADEYTNGNGIMAANFTSISRNPKMEYVTLRGDCFSDQFFHSASATPNEIRALWIHSDRITAATISEISSFKLITDLEVGGAMLRDESLADLYKLPNLKHLTIEGAFSHQAAEYLIKCPSLRSLTVRSAKPELLDLLQLRLRNIGVLVIEKGP